MKSWRNIKKVTLILKWATLFYVDLPQPRDLLINALNEINGNVGRGEESSERILLSSIAPGLWSTFAEDRENTYKLISWLNLIKSVVRSPFLLFYLFHELLIMVKPGNE